MENRPKDTSTNSTPEFTPVTTSDEMIDITDDDENMEEPMDLSKFIESSESSTEWDIDEEEWYNDINDDDIVDVDLT